MSTNIATGETSPAITPYHTYFCFNDIFGIGRPGHSLHVIDKDKQNNVDGVDELNSDGGILWPGRLSVVGKLRVL